MIGLNIPLRGIDQRETTLLQAGRGSPQTGGPDVVVIFSLLRLQRVIWQSNVYWFYGFAALVETLFPPPTDLGGICAFPHGFVRPTRGISRALLFLRVFEVSYNEKMIPSPTSISCVSDIRAEAVGM